MKKILIVDDNPKISFIAEKQISSVMPDSVVISSTSGETAIELAKKEKPQVVFLDIFMPGMNGYQLCNKLKNEPQTEDIPVVLIISLEYNEENRLKATEAGADAFITKPINKLELILQLRAMLKIYEGNVQKKHEKQRLEKLVKERTFKLTAELKKRKETEKKLQQSREKFRKISSLSSDYSYSYKVISPEEMEMEWYFGAFEDITGYLPLKNIDTKIITKIVHPEDLDLLQKRTEKLLRGETVVVEFRIIRKDGEVRWIRDKCEPEWDKDHKKVIRITGSAQDITDRKKAAEETQKLLQQLIHKEKELQELNATKDKFFSIIAHDLKGPFGSVLGLSNIVKQRVEEGNFKSMEQLSDLLIKATTHSFNLLNNLLEWARTQTGSKRFYPVKQKLHETIIEAIDPLISTGNEKKIKIEIICSEKLFVKADPNMLKAIIRNLVSNALKYSYPASTVTISTVKKDANIEIAVIDQGKGISEKQKKKLFKIGEDVSTSGTQNEKGTGLGLLLCKEFVEIHGGKIRVESDEKSGATFYFTLPR